MERIGQEWKQGKHFEDYCKWHGSELMNVWIKPIAVTMERIDRR